MPTKGEDYEAILGDAGVGAADVAALLEAGAVVAASS